ncbi:MAG: flagellar biogenesis protein [Clostridiales bacterium]|nr:flagellar biogenesis protein [Clostridiales bacterium]
MEQKEIKKAVALSYDSNDQAPMVVAKGKGYVAQKLIEKAMDVGIPLIKSPEQADALSQVDVGEYIPPELYQAVAEIYAFLVELDGDLDKY